MKEIKISIIVPCYKVEAFLKTCIESVQNQSYQHWELILVDDGSPDRSGDICEQYAKNDDRIIVIHKQNGGVAAARNSAIKIATGHYTSFLDADDFLHHDYIKELVKLCLKYNADIVQCGYIRGNNNTFPTQLTYPNIKEYTNHSVFTLDAAKVIVWGKLIKTEIVKNILFPEGRFFEDDLVTWRWYYAAKKIVVTSTPYYYYRLNEKSTMAMHKKKPNISFIEAYDERINFFREMGEKDLEECSKLQLCKCIVLVYGNKLLNRDQKHVLKNKFSDYWIDIKESSIINLKFKIIFSLFSILPNIIGKYIQMKNL